MTKELSSAPKVCGLPGAFKISVIIPTKDRPKDLELTVRTLLRQGLPDCELIIVDQSASDETCQTIENVFAQAQGNAAKACTLRLIHDSSISGADVARNRAMDLAQGDIWLFLDDDVILEDNFLRELSAAYRSHPQVSGISGIITNYRRPSFAFRAWAATFVTGRFHDERQPIYWRADRLRDAEPIRVRKFTGALMSFRADVIRELRFHGAVTDGEDTDFCTRLGSEAVLAIAPKARLAHNKSPIGRCHDHWLNRFVRENHYQYHRNWNTGFANRLSFAWLNVGCAIVAVMAAFRRASLSPLRAIAKGAREAMDKARQATQKSADAYKPFVATH